MFVIDPYVPANQWILFCLGGEPPPSPHDSGSDNDHQSVPVISSPIRLTPEPKDVVGRGQRSQQPGKGTQGPRKESHKLPVKERLYLSKRDIGTWCKPVGQLYIFG